MCFVWISEKTAIISLYSINWLVFIAETECVYCAVQVESLNITEFNRSLEDFNIRTHCTYICIRFVWVSKWTAVLAIGHLSAAGSGFATFAVHGTVTASLNRVGQQPVIFPLTEYLHHQWTVMIQLIFAKLEVIMPYNTKYSNRMLFELQTLVPAIFLQSMFLVWKGRTHFVDVFATPPHLLVLPCTQVGHMTSLNKRSPGSDNKKNEHESFLSRNKGSY
jgi:hypothetical protein